MMENESCYVCDYAKHEINRGIKEVRCGLNNRFVAYPKLGCSNCKKTCTTQDIDRAAILQLCNEIEDIAQNIKARTMSDSYFQAQCIIDKARNIGKVLNNE